MDAWCTGYRRISLPLFVVSCISQIVQRLIKAGSPTTTRDSYGNTLFHGAAHGGNPLVFQALLDAGVDVSARNREGFTPLMIAAKKVFLVPSCFVVVYLCVCGRGLVGKSHTWMMLSWLLGFDHGLLQCARDNAARTCATRLWYACKV